jgi:hypothetical protein
MEKETQSNVVDMEDFQKRRRQTDLSQTMAASSQTTGAEQIAPLSSTIGGLGERVSYLEQGPREYWRPTPNFIRIFILPSRNLKRPLDVIVEPDEDGFIARNVDLPLYGVGEDPNEAVEMLKREVESLYEDLMEDDDFSEKWLRIKRFLSEIIVD